MQCTAYLDCPRPPGEGGRCWWHAAEKLDVPLRTPLGVAHRITDPRAHPPGWSSAGHIGSWSQLTW